MNLIKLTYILIITLFISSCKSFKPECLDENIVTIKSKEYLISKSDSLLELRKIIINQKNELHKKGVIMDIDFNQSTYFKQNCSSTEDLDYVFFIIGSMLNNEKIKARIIGNQDNFEQNKNSSLSIKRAKFIRHIMMKNGIKKNRIILFDAKNNRPSAPIDKNGKQENRRVDFEIF